MPAFAMTINKSQGGTFDCVEIDLTQPVFAHGQLYVAFSRVRSFRSLHILLPDGTTTYNHVYREILDGSHRDVPDPPVRSEVQPDGHYHAEHEPENEHQNLQMHRIPTSTTTTIPTMTKTTTIPASVHPLHPSPTFHHHHPQVTLLFSSLSVPFNDIWAIIDTLSPDQRMNIHAQLIAHIAASAPRPHTPPPPSHRPHRPPPRPTPIRKQPHRKTKE